MNYDGMRHFADSWGLVLMAVLYVGFVGWTFRKGGADCNERAANSIFKDDEHV